MPPSSRRWSSRSRAACTASRPRASRAGDTVAVVGLGPIGLMLCACVADAGGRPVGVGSRPERRALAPSSAPSWARRRRGRRDRGGRHGRGVGARARARPPRRHRPRLRRPPREARVAVDPYRIHYEEVTLRGAFHHTPRHVRAALAFLGSGAYPFERLITHQVGLEGVAGAARRPAARLPQGRRRSRGLEPLQQQRPRHASGGGARLRAFSRCPAPGRTSGRSPRSRRTRS